MDYSAFGKNDYGLEIVYHNAEVEPLKYKPGSEPFFPCWRSKIYVILFFLDLGLWAGTGIVIEHPLIGLSIGLVLGIIDALAADGMVGSQTWSALRSGIYVIILG